MNELIGLLVQQLNVGEDQAKGGAGLLLKLAKSRLGGGFDKVAEVVPDAQGLIDSAPEGGGAGKLLGQLAGALGGAKAGGLGNLASLAEGFGKLKLDAGMVQKFVSIILDFVKGKGGAAVMQTLAKVLQGAGPAAS